jgi:hypothetical protein
MSQQQLIDLHFRLQRKLSASTGTWCSGRVDSLTLALRKVERELLACAQSCPSVSV